MMAHLSSNIFSRLETLRKWQEEQQERLLKQQSDQTAFLSAEQKRLNEALEENKDVSPVRVKKVLFNDSLPIENTPQNVDDQIILSPKRDFNALLDEKLKTIDENEVNVKVTMSKPKKPFLKKGTGLARYRLTDKNPSKSTKPARKSTLKPETPKIQERASWAAVFDQTPVPSPGQDQSIEQRAFERQLEKELALKEELEREREFKRREQELARENREALEMEQKIKKLLEKDYGMQKQSVVEGRRRENEQGSKNREIESKNELEMEQKIKKYQEGAKNREILSKDEMERKLVQLLGNEQDFRNGKNELEMEQKVMQMLECGRQSRNMEIESKRELEKEAKRNELARYELDFVQTLKQGLEIDRNHDKQRALREFEKELVMNQDLNELRIFEMLEQKALNSSFCSTSSVITRLLGVCTPVRPAPTTPQRNTSIETPVKQFRDESTWDSEEEDSDSSTISESSCETESSAEPQFVNVATNTAPFQEPPNTDLLRQRLEELEKEIETFREENNKVTKVRNELDKEKKKFQKEMEEQRKQMEEERKRMGREKQLLNDKYQREMKNGTRKDREEFNALKNELASVREELKMKESRYGASQARQRNQIRSLEKEIAALKAENDTLRKHNGKLQSEVKQVGKKTQPPSDTKVLHEINKNLSLLTKQQRRRTISGCSSPTSDKENEITEPKSTKKNKKPAKPDLSKSTIDPSFDSVARDYERVFGLHDIEPLSRMDGRASSENTEVYLDRVHRATTDRIERLLPDGTKEITYSNGNVKSIAGEKVTMRYFNGDVKETNSLNATVRYYYAEANIWHTTFAESGLEVLEFPDGQVEKRHKDGSTEVSFPDGCVRCTSPLGTETVSFPDGTIVVNKPEGDKVLTLPNGQKEVHTSDHKRREYPDGTVKLLYPDGTQETRYANGRIRLKDINGQLIMDTADSRCLVDN